MITLELPYPVSVNAYWLASGTRRYISKRGREFKNSVAQIWKDSGHGVISSINPFTNICCQCGKDCSPVNKQKEVGGG